MSLRWNFETDCIGYIIYKNEKQTFLYSGNALFIEVTNTQSPAQLVSCATSRKHLQIKLGLWPKQFQASNLLDDGTIDTIILHSDYKETPYIVRDLLRAKWNDMPRIVIYQP